MRTRNIDRKVHQVTQYESVEHFMSSYPVNPGVNIINENGLPIDFLYSQKDGSKVTFFMFHGAIEPHFKLPVLSGLGITGGVDAHRVFISDPALVKNEELLLSWYAGCSEHPHLQNDLVSIFKKILKDNGSQRAVFFGGSGGGYAALYFASQINSSVALVFNPQTSLRKYDSKAVHMFTNLAYEIDSREYDPLSLISDEVVLDVCKVYQEPVPAQVIYLQNKNDVQHVNRHMKPFLEKVHPDNRVYTLVERWRDGHTPPPKDLLSGILNSLSNKNRSVEEISFDFGIK